MYNHAYRSSVPYGYPTAAYPTAGSVPGGAQPYPPAVTTGVPITPSGTTIAPTQSPGPATPGLLPMEQSYIENILRLNLGKIATVYQTFENNTQWNAKIFKGRVEAAGRDHIILSDPKTGMRYLLLMVNTDYITFDEELKYTYPYAAATPAGR